MALTKTKGQQGMLKRREGYGINRTSKRQPARLRKQSKATACALSVRKGRSCGGYISEGKLQGRYICWSCGALLV